MQATQSTGLVLNMITALNGVEELLVQLDRSAVTVFVHLLA